MDNQKINQDVYDRYVDASVALFMEYYCAALSDDIHRKMDQMQAADFAFPESLDIRCKRAIKKEYAIRKRKQFVKSAAKGLRYMAIFAVALLALSSALFISVEAVRVPIINYYISQNDEYLEITSQKPSASDIIDKINTEDPLVGILPDDYELTMLKNMLPEQIIALYKKTDGNSVYFSIASSVTIVRVDTENAQIVESIQICGCDGMLVVKDGETTVAWGDKNTEKTLILTSSELTKAELVKVAEQFMQSIS